MLKLAFLHTCKETLTCRYFKNFMYEYTLGGKWVK